MLTSCCRALAAGWGDGAEGGWCICRQDLPDATLQKTLDYACGAGADCRPVLQGGACFAPNTVRAHCSYAVNSFYQRSGQSPQACVFSSTAFVSTNDPSTRRALLPSFFPSRTAQCSSAGFLMLRLLAGTSGCLYPATQG
jgi:hypothetical protein